MNEGSDQNRYLWKSFAAAIDTELRPAKQIRGASGLDHQVQAVSVDEKCKRLVIISAEANPRTAALMQVDIQATIPDTKVLVARPIAFDVGTAVRNILAPLGISQIEIAEAKRFLADWQNSPDSQQPINEKDAEKYLGSAVANIGQAELPILPLVLNFATQLSNFPWSEIGKIFDETSNSGVLDFNAILSADALSADLEVGVCPIPLFDFSQDDLEVFLRGSDPDHSRMILKRLGIYQYFYPAADQLALGVVERGIATSTDVVSTVENAPTIGHPFGEAELVKPKSDIIDTISQLKDLGYLAEGEFGIEISDAGKTVRSTVKFKPRESIFAKILARVSFNASISPSDLIKP